jgi:hypothetical protein
MPVSVRTLSRCSDDALGDAASWPIFADASGEGSAAKTPKNEANTRLRRSGHQNSLAIAMIHRKSLANG